MLSISNEKDKHTIHGRSPMLHLYKKAYPSPICLDVEEKKASHGSLQARHPQFHQQGCFFVYIDDLLTGKTERYKYSISQSIITRKLVFPNRPTGSKHNSWDCPGSIQMGSRRCEAAGNSADKASEVKPTSGTSYVRGFGSSHNTSKLVSSSHKQNLDLLRPFLPFFFLISPSPGDESKTLAVKRRWLLIDHIRKLQEYHVFWNDLAFKTYGNSKQNPYPVLEHLPFAKKVQ